MSAEMFNEAVQAVKAGQRKRAKDLLTRLLKTEPNNAEHWIWMSAVVETEKEQIFCLQKAYKLDAASMAARRGLVLLGAMSPEEAMRLLKDAQNLMLKTEELLNDSSRGKALETEEELMKKLAELLKEEEKNDPTVLQKKILEKIQKLLQKTEKKQTDTVSKLNEIIKRAKT